MNPPDLAATSPPPPAPDLAPGGLLATVWSLCRRICSGGWALLGWITDLLIGLPALLAMVATTLMLPGLQLAAYGYMLSLTGRVARSGRIRDAMADLRTAKRTATGLLGTTISLAPALFILGLLEDGAFIEPTASHPGLWVAFCGLGVVGSLNTMGALKRRHGRLLAFFRPLCNSRTTVGYLRSAGFRPGLLAPAKSGLKAAWTWTEDHLWLGLRGVVTAGVWLAPGTLILTNAVQAPALLFLGGLFLIPAVTWLPVVLARLTLEDRLSVAVEPRRALQVYRRAPFAFALALVALMLPAMPLYLFKIEALPSPVLVAMTAALFVILLLPGKILSGWALARANRREEPVTWLVRWLVPCTVAPVVVAYVAAVAVSQLFVWEGRYGLIDHHAFLLPLPY